MTKADLITAIADHSGKTKIDTEVFLNATLEVIQDTLKEGDSIPLIGFGTFSVATRSARQGRNPQTGKPIQIAESRTVKFSAGSKLKAAVNS